MVKKIIKKIIKKILLGKNYSILNELNIGILLINRVFMFIGLNKTCKILVNYTSSVSSFEKISFSNDKMTLTSFCVSGHCYIQAINGIKLGKNFLFAPGIKLISANHDLKQHDTWIKTEPITIGDDVWLGANVVVLPGVSISDNCVIGAGAVITKSFLEKGSIIVGNPAKVVGNKFY